MIPDLPTEIIGLLRYILPGFVAGWVFYSLTAHQRPDQFQQLIQALIFTLLVQGSLPAWQILEVRWVESFRQQTDLLLLTHSMLVGSIISLLANKDLPHRLLRQFSFSSQSTYPSEWVGVLSRKKAYMVFHLDGNRRLYGWPREWPQVANVGHFYIEQPSWLLGDGSEEYLGDDSVDGILIDVKEIEFIEIMKEGHENG